MAGLALPTWLTTGSTLPQVVIALRQIVKALSGALTLPGGNFTDAVTIEKDQASAFNALAVINNTANAAADVLIKLLTVSGSGGDTVIWFNNNVTNWTMGLDNSDADAFVISQNAALGTTNALRIDAASRDVLFVQNFGFNSGTAFKVSFDHGATSDRIITIQDLDGTMALIGANNVGNFTTSGSGAFGTTLASNGEFIAKTPVNGPLTANYTLTNAYADLVGCSASVSVGNWFVTLVCDFLEQQGAGSDLGQAFLGQLVAGTATATITNSSAPAILAGVTIGQRATVVQNWLVNVTVAGTIKAQAEKSGGTGTSIAVATLTNLTAVYIGKP